MTASTPQPTGDAFGDVIAAFSNATRFGRSCRRRCAAPAWPAARTFGGGRSRYRRDSAPAARRLPRRHRAHASLIERDLSHWKKLPLRRCSAPTSPTTCRRSYRAGAARARQVADDGRASGIGIEHDSFANFPERLNAGDVLVINDTRVIPARLFAQAEGGDVAADRDPADRGQIGEHGDWEAWCKPAKRVKAAMS